jgi:transposase InsO family protein
LITIVELLAAMADYIENFYNSARRHSSRHYLTPDEFEDLYLTTQTETTFSSPWTGERGC